MTLTAAQLKIATMYQSAMRVIEDAQHAGRKADVRQRPYGMFQVDSRDARALIDAGLAERDTYQIWLSNAGLAAFRDMNTKTAITRYTSNTLSRRANYPQVMGLPNEKKLATLMIANGCGL